MCQIMWHDIPEDSGLDIHYCESQSLTQNTVCCGLTKVARIVKFLHIVQTLFLCNFFFPIQAPDLVSYTKEYDDTELYALSG